VGVSLKAPTGTNEQSFSIALTTNASLSSSVKFLGGIFKSSSSSESAGFFYYSSAFSSLSSYYYSSGSVT